ncbi:MAG TPA: aminotransferase class I/II-fold pyridoxal phosphate-dependent enzyme [Cyclobacteriaceae bacterium]|nr:aminotransferase class I/II-fold pyridoxal phosphate-dependent enzyme [Cyclobacteriaceae bacterium]
MKNLSARKQTRSLKLPTGGVDFTSNDYLGLSRSEELHQLIGNAWSSQAVKRNGSTGSRLLSGNSELIEDTEKKLAAIFNSETTLLFDSGYSANLAVLSTLPQRGDTIIMDELAHASLKDGARLSLASKWNFRHNDMSDLERKLAMAEGEKWIVLESIYSMDGDTCPLRDACTLAEKSAAHIILDEAHSTGVMGAKGNGLANRDGLQHKIDVRVYTFGKAMGIHGACVSSGAATKDLLVNFSRPFIYTTAPTDHSVISVSSAFDFLGDNIILQDQLKANIDLFTSLAGDVNGWNRSSTQIQAVLVPGFEEVTRAASQLRSAGFDVRPILSPTVKEGQERLRICIHTFNTKEEIRSLIGEMKALGI